MAGERKSKDASKEKPAVEYCFNFEPQFKGRHIKFSECICDSLRYFFACLDYYVIFGHNNLSLLDSCGNPRVLKVADCRSGRQTRAALFHHYVFSGNHSGLCGRIAPQIFDKPEKLKCLNVAHYHCRLPGNILDHFLQTCSFKRFLQKRTFHDLDCSFPSQPVADHLHLLARQPPEVGDSQDLCLLEAGCEILNELFLVVLNHLPSPQVPL